jgi:hypothetical protein
VRQAVQERQIGGTSLTGNRFETYGCLSAFAKISSIFRMSSCERSIICWLRVIEIIVSAIGHTQGWRPATGRRLQFFV